VVALTPFRNRDAALTLAVFIARFWSVPGRVGGSFPIDRRELADHEGLELTEAQVRGAIKTLEAVGYLDRAIPASKSRYKATEQGLHRKPILYVFGSEYGSAFVQANKRAQAARGGVSGSRRAIPASTRSRASVGLAGGLANSPKSKSQAKPKVIMGELAKTNGLPAEPSQNSALERALQRLGMAIGKPSLGAGA
jgi:hypothetical protein